MKPTTAFILKFMLLLCSMAMVGGQVALAGENKALKADLERQFVGKTVVSKIVFGGRATPRGYDPRAEYPVNTLVDPGSGEVTYRVEWGLATRKEVSRQEMRRSFDSGTSFRVTGIDLKDDRLELRLESSGSGTARLKLTLGAGWQSKFNNASVQAQLARVFVLDQRPEPAQGTTVANASLPELPHASPSATIVYRRDPNAPKIEGRISEDDFRAVLAAFDAEDVKALSTLSQDAAVLSRSLLTYQKAYRSNSDGASRPQLQAISQLQDRLGKNLQPQSDGDAIVMNEVFKRCLRVSQLGQARDEQGRLYGAGRDDAAFQRLFLSNSAVDLTRKVPQDVETERAQRAIIDRAKAAAISVEQSLDSGDLIEANRQYKQTLSDSQLPTVQQYLQRTAAFRQDLESYVAANQLHEHPGISLSELVTNVAHEQESLQSSQSKPLTKAFLERTLPTDKAELKRRLDSLPAIKINKASYEMPAKFGATTAANAQEKSEFLKGMLDDLDSKLAGVSEMEAVVTRPQVMAAVGEELGDASLAVLKGRQQEIAELENQRSELAGQLTTVQAQVEQYHAEEQKREAEQRERVENLAILHMPKAWPKSQCIRAVNNFFQQGPTTFMADARALETAYLLLVSTRLMECANNYAWTYQERNQLAIPLPFSDVAAKEQEWITQAYIAKVVNFIRQRGLVQQFAWEVGHNTIVLEDCKRFLEVHQLTFVFINYDMEQSDKYFKSQPVGVASHGLASFLGVDVKGAR